MKKLIFDLRVIRAEYALTSKEFKEKCQLLAAVSAIIVVALVGYYAGGFPFLP